MKYAAIWAKVLNPQEEVKYEFSVGDRYRKVGLIMWIIIGVITLFAGIGIIFILFALFYFGFYLKAANAYAFTDRRVLIHTGWLSTRLVSIEYQKITDVTIHEPFLSRVLFHTGRMEIDTAGTNKESTLLKNIARPYEIKKKLDELRHHI